MREFVLRYRTEDLPSCSAAVWRTYPHALLLTKGPILLLRVCVEESPSCSAIEQVSCHLAPFQTATAMLCVPTLPTPRYAIYTAQTYLRDSSETLKISILRPPTSQQDLLCNRTLRRHRSSQACRHSKDRPTEPHMCKSMRQNHHHALCAHDHPLCWSR